MATPTLIPKHYDGTPLYEVTEIMGKKYCVHKVFGLQNALWFKEHNLKASDTGVPIKQIPHPKEGFMWDMGDDFKEGEKLETARRMEWKNICNHEKYKDDQSTKSLIEEAHKLFN